MADPPKYYIDRRRQYQVMFDLVVRSARPVLVKTYPGQDIPQLIIQARREFVHLLPQLPYIGGKHPFTEFLVFTAMELALYRVDQVHGRTVEQTGTLVYEIGRAFLTTSPAFLLRLFAPMNFSRKYIEKLKQRALESHQHQYPEDYVYNFVEGDGQTFDYGVDYLECASCKFLARQSALELAQYTCPGDILYSESFGWGLIRTQTLAEGADHCDFRFKMGGPTRVAVPAALQHVISGQD
jgi:hypothetical protein